MPGKLPLRRWAPWLIALAGLAAYANSLTGVFVLDDQRWIVESSPLRQLWPPSSSRPLVHLTLALNYAWSGLAPWSYHIVNLVIHVLAGLTLYGLARRTLPHEPAESAAGLAASVALLWLVHPIQTESVTYVIQRAESLMGLFYLLTLYCAARGPGWEAGAVLACLAGMLTKPTMVTAPLAVVVCDHAFWGRHRWKFYAALAATWLALAWALRAGAGDWERSAGYGFQAVSALDYAMSQPAVIMHYLRLMVWPHPLCLDYAWPVGVSWPATVAVAVALAATGWSLWRRPAAGAVAALFWLTLAPSSSFIPINDLAFEHRMYLPSAAVMAGNDAPAGDGRVGRDAARDDGVAQRGLPQRGGDLATDHRVRAAQRPRPFESRQGARRIGRRSGGVERVRRSGAAEAARRARPVQSGHRVGAGRPSGGGGGGIPCGAGAASGLPGGALQSRAGVAEAGPRRGGAPTPGGRWFDSVGRSW
jgi:hypothetical protein